MVDLYQAITNVTCMQKYADKLSLSTTGKTIVFSSTGQF